MKTVRLRVRGRVQGVGYRAWTVSTADSLGVHGWVRNRSDGSLEILATATEDALAALIEKCRLGPAGARVDELAASDDQDGDTLGFDVRPTE